MRRKNAPPPPPRRALLRKHEEERMMMMMKKKKNKKTSSSLLERDDDCVLFSSLGSLCRQKLASFQDKLSCPICKEFFTLPVTLVRCGHTFCGKCLNDYVRTFQDDKKRKCPRCKGPVTHESDWDNTGEVAVKPNELVEEIVESWKKVLGEKTSGGRGEEKEEEEEEEEEEVHRLPNPIPPPTKYHLLPGSKQAEKNRKTAELRDDLEKKYGFNRKTLHTQTYDQLKEKYVDFRDRYNTELKLFQRKPDMESVVKNMESIETSIREEAEAAKKVNKATMFFNPKTKKIKSNEDQNNIATKIDRELMKKLVEQADANMQGRGLQKKQLVLERIKQEKNVVKETIEILSDEEDEEEEPLPLSQPNLKYVDSEEEEEEEEEEDILRTQDIHS